MRVRVSTTGSDARSIVDESISRGSRAISCTRTSASRSPRREVEYQPAAVSETSMPPTYDPTAPGVTASAGSNGGRLGKDTVTDDQAPPEALKDIGTRL